MNHEKKSEHEAISIADKKSRHKNMPAGIVLTNPSLVLANIRKLFCT
jgi:hypothetical protein